MNPYDLNDRTYLLDSVFPFGDFLCDELSKSSSIGGQYQLNGASLFDTEYIDSAMLKGSAITAIGNFISDYTFPAMQHTQNEPSPYHTEWQSLVTDSEQIFQAQRGVRSPGVGFPNALGTSAVGHASFYWPEYRGRQLARG